MRKTGLRASESEDHCLFPFALVTAAKAGSCSCNCNFPPPLSPSLAPQISLRRWGIQRRSGGRTQMGVDETFTSRSHSDHQTSKSSSILKVLRCCLDPLTHGQLGLSRPEMTDRKSVARRPQRPPRGSLAEQGSGIFRPAPAGDTRWTQAWPDDSLQSSVSSPLAPFTIRALQSWRLVTAARGASTGTSGAAPAPLLDQVTGSTRQAPGCSDWLAWPQLRPQTTQDQAGDQHPLFLLPHSRSGQGRGFRRRDHLRAPVTQGAFRSPRKAQGCLQQRSQCLRHKQAAPGPPEANWCVWQQCE